MLETFLIFSFSFRSFHARSLFLINAHNNIPDALQADTELEFRGWIDSLMHEIKRLIAEKEKYFALNQKTISSNGTNLASFRVTDQSRFVTELDTFSPVSGNYFHPPKYVVNIISRKTQKKLIFYSCIFLDNTHNKGAIVQPHNNEEICSKEEDEESNLSIANSSILSLQVIYMF